MDDEKEKRRIKTAKWRAANPEANREINQRSHHKNKEKRNAYCREYREQNLDHMRHLGREWSKVNLDKQRGYKALRRAAKAHATPIWASDEFDSFAVEEMFDLAQLRTNETGAEWHVDHRVPLRSEKVCGLHCMANMQVITAAANHSKGNRHWPQM